VTQLGTDPEFFIFDKDDKPVPAHTLGFPTKENKLKSEDIVGVFEQYATLFRDGYAIEANVTYAPSCRAMLATHIRSAVRAMRAKVGPNYHIGTEAAVRIRLRTQMRGAPDDVSHFGCEPSFDGYRNGAAKVVDIDAFTHSYRYAGGHMHFGTFNNKSALYRQAAKDDNSEALQDPTNFPLMAKIFDLLVGLPLTIIYDDSKQFLRRRHYGQAGEYRPQIYPGERVGFEYRTPPPQLWNHHAIAGLFFGVGKWIVNNYATLAEDWNPNIEQDLQRAINHGTRGQNLLQSVPGFYTPETILSLKGVKEIKSLFLPDYTGSTDSGWIEFAELWGLKKTIPEPNFKRSYTSAPYAPTARPKFSFIAAKAA